MGSRTTGAASGGDESYSAVSSVGYGSDPVFSCWFCTFTFATGPMVGFTNNSWMFSGGNLSITGGVDLLRNGDMDDPGNINPFQSLLDGSPDGTMTQLLSGSFTGTPTVTVLQQGDADLGLDSIVQFTATFLGTLNPSLVAFFGFPTDVGLPGELLLNFNMDPSSFPGDDGFYGTSITAGTVSTGNFSPVPEVNSVLLLGFGMGVLACIKHYRFSSK